MTDLGTALRLLADAADAGSLPLAAQRRLVGCLDGLAGQDDRAAAYRAAAATLAPHATPWGRAQALSRALAGFDRTRRLRDGQRHPANLTERALLDCWKFGKPPGVRRLFDLLKSDIAEPPWSTACELPQPDALPCMTNAAKSCRTT